MDRLRTLFASLTPRGRMALAGTVAGVLVFGFLFMKMASSTSYTTLVSGVDPADTGKITAALSEKGIKNELQNNGTAVGVEKAKLAEARIAIAEGGLTSGSKPGYELFDKQKMGASEFQQKVTYKRALEGELSKTIGEMDGVSGAKVQLTLPDEKLFVDEQQPATAAVMLSGATNMDPGSARGIARLAASSVEGLKPDQVTITDSSGGLLWPNGDGEGGAGGGGSSKQAVEQRYERATESSVNAMLAQTAGPGKARVQVNADVDANQASQSKLEYERRGTPIREKTETETLEGGAGGGGGGASGTTGNVPSYAGAGAAAGGASEYEKTSRDRDMGVGKTVTRTKIAPGAVERQSVALVVDDSVPASQLADLRKAVSAAVGLDRERQDTLAVSRMPFATPEEPGGGAVAGILGIAKWVALGIGTLLFLLFSMRQLKRRENAELTGEPQWLREINSPYTLAQLEHPTQVQAAYEPLAPPPENPDRRVVEDASSERLAHQVRSWMKE